MNATPSIPASHARKTLHRNLSCGARQYELYVTQSCLSMSRLVMLLFAVSCRAVWSRAKGLPSLSWLNGPGAWGLALPLYTFLRAPFL